jgi:hypothetical protein
MCNIDHTCNRRIQDRAVYGTVPQGFYPSLVRIITEDTMSNKRKVSDLRDAELTRTRDRDSARNPQQKMSQPPAKARRDMAIIRKVFAACGER